MKQLILIFAIFTSLFLKAQDKIVYRDGHKMNCKIITVNKNTVTYMDSANASGYKSVSKKDVIMAEFANGNIHIFGVPKTAAEKEKEEEKKKKQDLDGKDNMIGLQVIGSLVGRVGVVYERLFREQTLGVAIPLQLSFNPYSNQVIGNSYSGGANFITGLDVNYYFEAGSKYNKFFVGPRIRYGTDVFMANIEGLTVQAQNGFLFTSPYNRTAHTIAFGFGFIRIMNLPKIGGIDPKQSYPWMSLTYRFNIRW